MCDLFGFVSRLSPPYNTVENFQGRKLSQIGKKYDFREEDFHRLLACAAPKDATSPNFMEKTCE